MSSAGLRAALEAMEAWVADPAWDPDPEALAVWQADFTCALAEAERGADWPGLQARAHAAGHDLERHIDRMIRLREGMRAELGLQDQGSRALRAYGSAVH